VRFSSLLYFYRLRLRTRWVQELFALVGIAGGVALLFAAQVANNSLTGSVEQLVDATIGRAELAITARSTQGLDQALVERTRELPGVRVAAPMLEIRGRVVHEDRMKTVTILGADRSLTGLGGALLSQFRDAPLPTDRVIGLPAPIVDRLHLAIGGRMRLDIAGRVTRTRLAASLGQRELSDLIRSPIAVAPLLYAQRLSGLQGRVSRILVSTEPGRRDAVERELRELVGGSLNVGPADYDLVLLRQAAAPTNQSTAMFAAMSALVGFLFAFNAMLLTLADRQRLILALRIDGYAPAAIFKVVLFDALVLGVVASAVGLVLGDVVSRQLFDAAPGYLSLAFAIGEQRVVEWQAVAIAGCAGVAAALLAAMLPLRDVVGRQRIRVESGGSEIGVKAARTALWFALGALAASIAIPPSTPGPALIAIGLLVAAMMLMLPAILLGVLALLERLLAFAKSAIPMISLGELRSMPARSVAVAATGALAVFGSVASQGARGDLQAGLDRSTHDINGVADVWASAPGQPNILATDAFDGEDAAATLRRLPSVRAVRFYRSAFLDYGDRRVWVVAQPEGSGKPVPPTQLLDGDLAVATRRLQRGGWAVISDGIASAHHLAIGDRFMLPSPRARSFRVAALSTNIGWPPGTIIISPRDFRESWKSAAPSAFQVTLDDGVAAEQGREQVARALGQASALNVETTVERERRHRAISRQALSRLNELSLLVLIAAVLALASATAGMVWQRRRRIASLKLDGFEDGTVWRALLLESGILLGSGCLAGAVFGLLGQQLLDRALGTVTGFPVVHSVSLGVAFASFALVTAVAVAVAGLPGYLAARVAPAVALQD
jgi:putative ABC transport system permease protein